MIPTIEQLRRDMTAFAAGNYRRIIEENQSPAPDDNMGEFADYALDEVLEDYWPSDFARGAYTPSYQLTFSEKSMPAPTKVVRKPLSVESNGSVKKPTVQKGYLGKSPLAMVVYGPSGIGKTDLCAHFPNCGFIIDPQERGIERLVEYNQTKEPVFIETVDTWSRALEQIQRAPQRGIQTLVLDSLTGFEKLCFHYHCEHYFDGNWGKDGFFAFQSGPGDAAKTSWPNFIDCIDGVIGEGINVILIAHTQVKPFNNPDGDNYDQHMPYLHKETWQVVHRWADAVLFYRPNIATVKKGLKVKAKTGQDDLREICTVAEPTFHAKNRYGLEPVIQAGSSGAEAYANWEAAFLKAIGRTK